MDIKDKIRQKLDVIDEGDINLDGEPDQHIEGFKAGLGWVLDELNR